MNSINGTSGNDDIQASKGGSLLNAGAGDDILRGRQGNDILLGGAGDDQMYGGAGGDQFRFFGDQIGGNSDTDRIYDLNFGEGDQLVFGNYNGLFSDDDGVNAGANGDTGIISSWEGLANAVQNAGARASFSGASGDVLFVTFDTGNGTSQTLRISNGYNAFINAYNDVVPV